MVFITTVRQFLERSSFWINCLNLLENSFSYDLYLSKFDKYGWYGWTQIQALHVFLEDESILHMFVNYRATFGLKLIDILWNES